MLCQCPESRAKPVPKAPSHSPPPPPSTDPEQLRPAACWTRRVNSLSAPCSVQQSREIPPPRSPPAHHGQAALCSSIQRCPGSFPSRVARHSRGRSVPPAGCLISPSGSSSLSPTQTKSLGLHKSLLSIPRRPGRKGLSKSILQHRQAFQ